MRHPFAFRFVLSLALLTVLVGCATPAPEADEVSASEPEQMAPPTLAPDLGSVVEVDDSPAQVAAAVAAAPEDRRESASVFGYDAEGGFVLLRQGEGELICIADNPGDERFHAACYQQSLEPYMARGRELRGEGMSGSDTLTARHEEIDAGALYMPRQAAAVYSLAGDPQIHDPATGAVDGSQARRIHAIYVAYATEESTGLSTVPPAAGAPWIMRPGTPTSHIMVVLEPAAEAAVRE